MFRYSWTWLTIVLVSASLNGVGALPDAEGSSGSLPRGFPVPEGSRQSGIFLAMGVKTETESQPKPSQPLMASGEVLVRFEDGVSPERIDTLLAGLNLRIKNNLGKPNLFVLTILDGNPVKATVVRLKDLPEVAEAGPNYLTFLNPPGKGAAPLTPGQKGNSRN